MKKIVSYFLITLLLICLTSCALPETLHEHVTSDWQYNETYHWRTTVCIQGLCDFNIALEEHIDDNKDSHCDICKYLMENNQRR